MDRRKRSKFTLKSGLRRNRQTATVSGVVDGRVTHERPVLDRWWRKSNSYRLYRSEHPVGRCLVGPDPAEWDQGAGVRYVDRMVPIDNEMTRPPYIITESKRVWSWGKLDTAIGSLLVERKLAAAEHDVGMSDIHLTAIFDGVQWDPNVPPRTVEVVADLCRDLGIEIIINDGTRLIHVTDGLTKV